MQIKVSQFFLLALTALLLSACDSAPSESDIRDAFSRQYAIEKAGQGPMPHGKMAAIQQLKLVGCMKAGSGGYRCDLRTSDGSVRNARLVKTDSTWELVEGN